MRQGLSIREFARREGCSDALVRKALKVKRLKAYADGSLNPQLVGSAWCEGNARAGKGAHRSSSARTAAALAVAEGETPAHAANRLLKDGAVELLDYSAALTLKENYLALLRRLEFETKSGELIEMATAEAILFDVFRAQRDAWLSWPVTVGPLVAADLGIDAVDRVTAILSEHIHRQISELGEPQPDFAGPH